MVADHERSSALLLALADESPEHGLDFEHILERCGKRAFGVMLIVVCLPAFLPLPAGAGAVSGPLAALLGLQLMIGMRRPWLPRRLREKRVPATRLRKLAQRIGPWLHRLQRLSRPRPEALITSAPGGFVVGAMITLLGIALSLPVPLTNYPLALLILAYAVALIERDGGLMLVLWLIGAVALGLTVQVSGELIEWVQAQLAS